MTIRSFITVTGLLLAGTLAFAATSVKDLRVQHADKPLAVEDRHPLFSWRMESDVRGQKQTAYQLSVIREVDGSELWNTGKVLSDRSVDVPYQGVALQAEKGYTVKLSVWDKDGKEYNEETRFETGLMSPKLSAWKGAQWIGSKELTLDASSQCIFDIQTRFRIVKGNTAAVILGADDFRLQSAFQNGYGMASKESYIRVEVEPSVPEIRICRVGYFPEDRADKPFCTINKTAFPETNLPEILSAADEHLLEIHVEVSDISFRIDGKDLITETPRRGGPRGFAGVGMMGGGPRASRICLNKMGSGGNYSSFPNLCSVGFAAVPGSEVLYTDYQILNAGQSVDRVVFDQDRYGVFAGIPGVEIDGTVIRVANPGGKLLQGWADPSHGAETQLRTEFKASKTVKEARLYATAMGIYNLYLNGKPVSDSWFTPGDSQYRETMGYHRYDVTALLKEGDNALAASLAGGWYSGYMTFTAANFNFFGDYAALLARLVITYEDGTREEIVTKPETWKAFKDGPVRLGSFFQGEHYDARKETEGWMQAGFPEEGWAQAEVIEQHDWVDFDLMARYDEPVKVRETLTAQRITPVSDAHTHIYDMGVNMVGVPEITIPAGWLKEGDTVILTYGEQLYPGLKGDSREYVNRFGKKGRGVAGHILFETNRAALDADFYTAAGSGAVTIRPTKTFRGYQYIQIYIPSHEGALPLENVKGLVLSSSEIPTGRYNATTSDGNKTGRLVNQLFKNIQRSQLGNTLTIPTDCPQRNERMGWTGDAQAYTRTGTYQADMQNFFRQWMVALRADQGVGNDREVPGGIGSTVPTFNKTDDPSFANGTTWSAAVCQVPWQLYSQYGDTRIVEENFDAMMDWLNGMAFYKTPGHPYLSSKAGGLADHLALDNRTPADLLNNAIYIHMMEVTAVMADAIGKTVEATILRERHARAVEDWNQAYVDPATGKTRGLSGKTVHTQASYATPLNFNVFNEENRPKAAAWLARLAAKPAESGPTPEELVAQQGLEDETTSAFGVLGSGNTEFDFKPYTITTGFSGTPNILPALSRNGYAEEAFRMISNTEYASWLYPVSKGATSIWERWNSLDTAFSEPNQNSMNSFNHFALGAVGEWMFEYQLGITTEPGNGAAGYQHFVLQPTAAASYTALEGSYTSNYGTIRSAWTAENGRMTAFRATIPANTSADVYIPVGDAVMTASSCEGAAFQGFTTRNGLRVAWYRVLSGSYGFTIGGSVRVE